MPIVRTFGCASCGYVLDVTLSMSEWDAPPPACPACATRTHQRFKPVAVGGSFRSRAVKLAEDIAEKDYGVADMKIENYPGVRNKVRYKDQNPTQAGGWVNPQMQTMTQALQAGRDSRLAYGSALDTIKSMPNLIEISKRRSTPW